MQVHADIDYKLALTISLLMVAGAFVRVYGLGEWDYYHDEIWHVYVASQPTLADVFYTNLKQDGHPMLGYVLWHGLLNAWNDPWMARLPSLVAGILCIPIGYFAGKEIFSNKNGGLFTAFFMAFSCLMIEQSNVVRGYSLMMLFALIMLWSVYRYRATHAFRYLLIYFFAALLGFLSEFAIAPLAVFTGLHLLYSIYKKDNTRLLHFSAYVAIHLLLLVHLAWFMFALHEVGQLDFAKSHFFIKVGNQAPLINVVNVIFFYLNFLNDMNPLFFLSMAAGSELIGAASAFCFLFFALAGLHELINKRLWWQCILVGVVFAVGIGFFYLDIVPLDRSRRYMGLFPGFLVLLYHGLHYFIIRGRVGQLIRSHTLLLVCALTLLLTAAYGVYGQQWRFLRPIEFQQTHEQTEEIFSFIEEHAVPDDLVLMDWSTYFHFWNRYDGCKVKLVSSWLAYADCYKAGFLVIRNDMRTDSLMLNMAEMQRAYRQLATMEIFAKAQHIWIAGIQHVNVKTSVLNPKFRARVISDAAQQYAGYKNKVDQVVNEQEAFARWAFNHAVYKKTGYAYACGLADDEVVINGNDSCALRLALLAFSKPKFSAWFLGKEDYQDPVQLLRKISQK